MKCTCGAELPSGSKFCGKCGRPVSGLPKLYCRKCGSQLCPGAKFCGKCGTPSDSQQMFSDSVSRRSKPGKSFLNMGALDHACRKAATYTDSWIGTIRKKTEPVSKWADSRVTDKKRAKQLIIVALVVGLCITFAGLAGKITMGKLSENLRNTAILPGVYSEFESIVNRSVGNAITKLIVSLVKNDSSGFASTIKQLVKNVSSISGDSYEITDWESTMIDAFAQETFAEIREELIYEVGAWWPLLQAMAYYRELITIGLIIAAIAAVLWFLLDGRLNDVIALNMMPVMYIGAGWTVLMIIITIISTYALSQNT